jgi:hypothetical protein
MEQDRIMKIFNGKLAGIIFITLNIIIIIIQTLIILRILPYNIIGGGRLENYNLTFSIAKISIIILVVEIIFIIIVLKYIRNKKRNILIKIGLWILFSLLFINLIGNILSKTLFEKIFMGIICVIQIINITIMMSENKKCIK